MKTSKILLVIPIIIFFLNACNKEPWGVKVLEHVNITGTIRDAENDTLISNCELVVASTSFSGGFYMKDTSYTLQKGQFEVVYINEPGNALVGELFVGRLDNYEITQSSKFLSVTGGVNHFDFKVKPLKKLLKIKFTDNLADSSFIETDNDKLNKYGHLFEQSFNHIKIPKFNTDTTLILNVSPNIGTYIKCIQYKDTIKQSYHYVSIKQDTVTLVID